MEAIDKFTAEINDLFMSLKGQIVTIKKLDGFERYVTLTDEQGENMLFDLKNGHTVDIELLQVIDLFEIMKAYKSRLDNLNATGC